MRSQALTHIYEQYLTNTYVVGPICDEHTLYIQFGIVQLFLGNNKDQSNIFLYVKGLD